MGNSFRVRENILSRREYIYSHESVYCNSRILLWPLDRWLFRKPAANVPIWQIFLDYVNVHILLPRIIQASTYLSKARENLLF